jgi:hypothetical protein
MRAQGVPAQAEGEPDRAADAKTGGIAEVQSAMLVGVLTARPKNLWRMLRTQPSQGFRTSVTRFSEGLLLREEFQRLREYSIATWVSVMGPGNSWTRGVDGQSDHVWPRHRRWSACGGVLGA